MMDSELEVLVLCRSLTVCGTMHNSLRCRTYSTLFCPFNLDYPCAPLGRYSYPPCRCASSWSGQLCTLVQPVSVLSILIRCVHALLPTFCLFFYLNLSLYLYFHFLQFCSDDFCPLFFHFLPWFPLHSFDFIWIGRSGPVRGDVIY